MTLIVPDIVALTARDTAGWPAWPLGDRALRVYSVEVRLLVVGRLLYITKKEMLWDTHEQIFGCCRKAPKVWIPPPHLHPLVLSGSLFSPFLMLGNCIWWIKYIYNLFWLINIDQLIFLVFHEVLKLKWYLIF